MTTSALDVSPADSPFANTLRSRRTINDFRPDAPPREVLLQCLELARWAPNHKLTEPWRFHLLGPQTVQAIVEWNAELTQAAKGPDAAAIKRQRWSQIPGWLAVSCRTSSDALRNEENYAAVCCAIQNLMLALWAERIGTKWSTGAITREERLARRLGIDSEQERIVGLLWYGYPASIPEMKRRPVSEVTIVHP